MKEILFIHSAGEQGDSQGSGPLLTALRQGLGPGFVLHAPPMPSEPSADAWLGACREHISRLRAPFALCGHSLGASIILKHLAERGVQPGTAGVVAIAAPFWGAPDWEVADFALPPNAATKLSVLPRLMMYHSQDDDVVPVAHLELYAKLLPNAVVRPVEGRGHCFEDGRVGDIVADLRDLPYSAASAA